MGYHFHNFDSIFFTNNVYSVSYIVRRTSTTAYLQIHRPPENKPYLKIQVYIQQDTSILLSLLFLKAQLQVAGRK